MDHDYRTFDFLRGDEPYKAHFRAKPHPCVEIRVVPARSAAQVRHGIWRAATAAKSWLRSERELRSGTRPRKEASVE